jgi:ribosome biogenesis protein UTP30
MADAKDELIASNVSAKQCKRAVDALMKHVQSYEKKREEHELLPGKEQNVWLQVTVKQMQPEKKLKPIKMYAALFYNRFCST